MYHHSRKYNTINAPDMSDAMATDVTSASRTKHLSIRFRGLSVLLRGQPSHRHQEIRTF